MSNVRAMPPWSREPWLTSRLAVSAGGGVGVGRDVGRGVAVGWAVGGGVAGCGVAGVGRGDADGWPGVGDACGDGATVSEGDGGQDPGFTVGSLEHVGTGDDDGGATGVGAQPTPSNATIAATAAIRVIGLLCMTITWTSVKPAYASIDLTGHGTTAALSRSNGPFGWWIGGICRVGSGTRAGLTLEPTVGLHGE
jgi:hypothetical protein